MNADTFTETFTVRDFDIDPEKRLSLGAMLRRSQQISTDHCASLGIDEAMYARTHTGFLLAKLAAEFYAPVRLGDCVTLTTRPSIPQHAIYHRCNDFTAPDGSLLCRMDSRWVLVDVRTRRVLRTSPEGMPMPYTRREPYAQLDVNVRRAAAQPLAVETAVYSRCDYNHHLNNTRYADILYDHLPVEEVTQHTLRRFVIAYHREIPLGTSFTLARASLGPGAYYFSGEGAAGRYFEAELVFDKK